MFDPFSLVFYEALGREIFVRRKMEHVSSASLASRVGTSRKTLALIEQGSRTPDLRIGFKAYLELGGSVACVNDALIATKYGLGHPTVLLRDSLNRDGERAKLLKTRFEVSPYYAFQDERLR